MQSKNNLTCLAESHHSFSVGNFCTPWIPNNIWYITNAFIINGQHSIKKSVFFTSVVRKSIHHIFFTENIVSQSHIGSFLISGERYVTVTLVLVNEYCKVKLPTYLLALLSLSTNTHPTHRLCLSNHRTRGTVAVLTLCVRALAPPHDNVAHKWWMPKVRAQPARFYRH